jgi:DNA polymerase-1
VLSELATEHPLPALILDWRKLAKLKSTYVDKLPDLIHPETGRVHTDFNQAVTATGRLSSSNPNLQNIPIRTEQGREIRREFVAEAGHKLVSADYAQIELRIIAHMSGDAGLISAFREGLDIHTATAARVFDVPLAEVTRFMRDRVKQVNYGIPYGISAFGLAQRLRIGTKEAQKLIDTYRASYPGVGRFLDELLEAAREKGYAETLLGRRRYFKEQITSRNPADRALAERIAVNMPVQGTQADMIKKAMVAIHHRLLAEGFAGRMILQVHDELVFEAPEAEVEALSALVTEEMRGALPLSVPIVVEIGVADNWLDAH